MVGLKLLEINVVMLMLLVLLGVVDDNNDDDDVAVDVIYFEGM